MAIDKVTIKIPRTLYDQVRKVTEGSGFSSPTEFIVYVLRDLVGDRPVGPSQGDLSEGEIAAVRKRLKSLGYL